MIFLIDVGNTNIVLGVMDEKQDKLLVLSRLSTDRHKTEDEYAVELRQILNLYGIRPESCTGGALSCVVPQLKGPLRRAMERMLNNNTVVTVSAADKNGGLVIKIDDPAVLGSDLVCGAVAAIKLYGPPCIVFDLGTATKISAIDKFGTFLGCSIMPGVGISLDALSARTATLPQIDLEGAGVIVGTNTPDSMKSGVILGAASMMDGMIRKYRGVLGTDAKVISTGGFANVITRFCETDIKYDPRLCLEGLYEIYRKNEGEYRK